MTRRTSPKRLEIIEDLIKGITPQIVSWKWEVPISTVYDVKNTFLECYYRLKRNVPDPRQLSFRFCFSDRDDDGEEG